MTILALVGLLAANVSMPETSAEPLSRFVADQLHVTRYEAASVDLDGDGRPEALIYADAPNDCGSGGCDLYILTRAGPSWRVVTQTSVTRLPIKVLATTTHGWRDLAVLVAGGGILQGHLVRLRFDGMSYPSNPTMPPATAIHGDPGKMLIGR